MKSIDYEILKYKVEYRRIDVLKVASVTFYTEEDAIKFIKGNRINWNMYRLIKIQCAVGNIIAE